MFPSFHGIGEIQGHWNAYKGQGSFPPNSVFAMIHVTPKLWRCVPHDYTRTEIYKKKK